MSATTFTSSSGDILTVDGDQLTVTNKFGDTFRGWLENGSVVTKSKIGLGYLSGAYREFVSPEANEEYNEIDSTL